MYFKKKKGIRLLKKMNLSTVPDSHFKEIRALILAPISHIFIILRPILSYIY